MNLEDYCTPWLPTLTWHRVKQFCREARNPHEVFMEAARHLREEGVTHMAIDKLRASASEGHKSARFFMAILYNAAQEETFRAQARNIIWHLRTQLGRKGMRILISVMRGWLTHHIGYGGLSFRVDKYVLCPDGYNPPFMADRGRKGQKKALCKICYVNWVFKHLHEHMSRQWPGPNALFPFQN
ncbi:hypothetical protein CJ030_MR2G011709 [Morella rubra]|uniref:Uncharacterized protein n=1 Tax=Morella rubra TaxID=262757 RepID=A0A6A1WJ32_9ROSI|nr:hypothetical protein CJ030_MR2G011709 [Morella rubra]